MCLWVCVSVCKCVCLRSSELSSHMDRKHSDYRTGLGSAWTPPRDSLHHQRTAHARQNTQTHTGGGEWLTRTTHTHIPTMQMRVSRWPYGGLGGELASYRRHLRTCSDWSTDACKHTPGTFIYISQTLGTHISWQCNKHAHKHTHYWPLWEIYCCFIPFTPELPPWYTDSS